MESPHTYSAIEESNGIPIIVVYDNDHTYATENGINYDKLTYQMLLQEDKKNQLKVQDNSPNGIIDRVLSDVLGLVVLYAGTFIMCDLYRTWRTGRWTQIVWMFIGPWNALTGAPLLHKISDLFDSHGAGSGKPGIRRCEDAYTLALKKCDVDVILGGSHGECQAAAQRNYQNCYTSSSEFADCYQQTLADCEDRCYDDPLIRCNEGTCSEISIDVDCLDALGYDPNTN